MTLKDLSQVYYLKQEVVSLKEKITDIKAKSMDTSAKLREVPIKGGKTDKIARSVERLDFYEGLLEKQLLRCDEELVKLNNYIFNCPDSFTRQLLRMRFVENYSWAKIAARMGTSEGTVKMTVYRYIKRSK